MGFGLGQASQSPGEEVLDRSCSCRLGLGAPLLLGQGQGLGWGLVEDPPPPLPLSHPPPLLSGPTAQASSACN